MAEEKLMTTDNGPAVPPTGSVISEEEAAALLERKGARPGEARPLDLAKLRITQGRLPLLEVVHQSFVGLFGKALCGLLKRDLQVSLQRIETQRTADYFAGLSLPASLNICSVKPLKGSALVCIDPMLISVLVDSFFGGSGRTALRDPERGMTPAELRFAQLVLKQMFADLKQAWTPVAQIDLELTKHETSPTFVNIAAPGDNLLVNRFLIELPSGAGHIDFVMPETMFEPLRESMRGNGPSPRTESAAHWPAAFREYLKDVKIEVRGLLAETRVSLRVLRGLKTGDVIPVDAPGAAFLLVNSTPVYSAKFGISRGHNALKLTGPVPPARPGSH